MFEEFVFKLMYNTSGKDHQLASSARAESVFKPVIFLEIDGSKMFERYSAVILVLIEFNVWSFHLKQGRYLIRYLLSLIAANPSRTPVGGIII